MAGGRERGDVAETIVINPGPCPTRWGNGGETTEIIGQVKAGQLLNAIMIVENQNRIGHLSKRQPWPPSTRHRQGQYEILLFEMVDNRSVPCQSNMLTCLRVDTGAHVVAVPMHGTSRKYINKYMQGATWRQSLFIYFKSIEGQNIIFHLSHINRLYTPRVPIYLYYLLCNVRYGST